ncbi:MAG: hypothetical protein VST70_09410, partial [Nitrospirota bacterium]|nr:hypothetical protein [Nitrospirota bacterium]
MKTTTMENVVVSDDEERSRAIQALEGIGFRGARKFLDKHPVDVAYIEAWCAVAKAKGEDPPAYVRYVLSQGL